MVIKNDTLWAATFFTVLVDSPSHSFFFFFLSNMSYSQKNASQKNNETIGLIQEKTLPLPFPWCLLTAAGAHATSVLKGVIHLSLYPVKDSLTFLNLYLGM